MRLKGAVTRHLAGWTGGVIERAEPDVAHKLPFGSLASGLNMRTAPYGRLAVRGGSQALLMLAEDDITDILGIWSFSPTGAIAIAYSATDEAHYAYALTDELEFALPVATPTELGSRVELTGWDTATKGRPKGDELFETFYVSDASATGRRPFLALKVVADALDLTVPTYDLASLGGEEAFPYTQAVYNSSLFLAGWDSEADNDAPHFVRNSLIGTPPEDAAGFDPDGYAIVGAHGQRVTAMEPGRDMLLVAKAAELYRIYGTGQALPGWHYAIQQVENTKGSGVLNPYAMKHVNGYWYGIGQSGTWRSDGVTVEPLGIPWRESWQRMTRLDLAWVAHYPDPDRFEIWFGFLEQGVSGYAEAPFTIWGWNVQRETWNPPHRYPRAFHFVNSILPGTIDAPSGQPASLEQRFGYGAMAATTIEGRFTVGDVEAETEVWGRMGSDPYTLQTTVPAGVSRFLVTIGEGQRMTVKLRHNKGGAVSAFSNAVAFFARLPAPTLTLTAPHGFPPAAVTATLYNPVQGSSVILAPATAAWSEVFDDAEVGSIVVDGIGTAGCTVFVAPDQGITLQAQLEHPSWPVGHQASWVDELTTHQVGCTTAAPSTAPTVRQQLGDGGMQPTSLTVRFHPHVGTYPYTRTFRIEYKLASDASWTTHSAVVINTANPHTTQSVTIGGLIAGRKYHVRCQIVELIGQPTYVVGATVDCFTALPVPTQSVQVIGSPGVRLTLTAPYNGASIVSYDALEAYTALYTNQPGTPVQYDTTVGSCGRANRFYARTYDPTWPEGYQYSDVVTSDVSSPCV